MKKYEPIEGSNKQLKIEVYYDKGGMNYFTYKNEPRGYWLSMRQVERKVEDHGVVIESYGMFSGAKAFLLEVKKKSDKAYERALVLAEEKLADLKSHVLAKAD